MEILGKNLKKFFDTIDSNYSEADITYAGNRYEVWEVSDELFKKMCDMNEEEFIDIAGEDAWWESCKDTSISRLARITYNINGEEMLGWACFSKVATGYSGRASYSSLSEYLREGIGVTSHHNVCACTVHLAKNNDMSMGELFNKYEG